MASQQEFMEEPTMLELSGITSEELQSGVMKKAHVRENVGQQQGDQGDHQQQGDLELHKDKEQPREQQQRDGVGGALLPRVITNVFGVLASVKSTALPLPVIFLIFLCYK